jgi:osmoprotectant transport system permease protein
VTWGWIPRNSALILGSLAEHLWLSFLPVVIGLVVAVPLGWLANHSRTARAVLVPAAGVLYTVPSLVLFVVLPGLLGTLTLDPINVVVALAVYTVALLVRSVADALAAVPAMVIAAATAMGFKPARRFVSVEFPLSVPVLIAGLRVATVSNISLVSVGALIGVGGLGRLFTDGFNNNNLVEVTVGIGLSMVLALVADGLLVSLGRVVTPWSRVGAPAGRST